MAKPKKKEQSSDKRIKKIVLGVDLSVHIELTDTDEIAAAGEDGSSQSVQSQFSIKSKHRPHKDFIDAMKEMRGPAFEAMDMKVDTKERVNYVLHQIVFHGDPNDNDTEISLILARKLGKLFTKPSYIDMPPFAMMQDQVFSKAGDVRVITTKILKEAWAYLGGKHEGDPQMPLFSR